MLLQFSQKLHPRDRTAVKTVGWRRWKYTENSENGFIGEKNYGHFFLDSQGTVMIDYLEKGKTVTDPIMQRYWSVWMINWKKCDQLRLARKKVLLHQDNAPAHTSTSTVVAIAKLHELGFELLPHPPYFPDLASCDFFFVS